MQERRYLAERMLEGVERLAALKLGSVFGEWREAAASAGQRRSRLAELQKSSQQRRLREALDQYAFHSCTGLVYSI